MTPAEAFAILAAAHLSAGLRIPVEDDIDPRPCCDCCGRAPAAWRNRPFVCVACAWNWSSV